jgi:hypothetical protein
MSFPLEMPGSGPDDFFLLLIIASRFSFSVNDLRRIVDIWIRITNRIRNEKTTSMPTNASFNPSNIIATSQISHQAYFSHKLCDPVTHSSHTGEDRYQRNIFTFWMALKRFTSCPASAGMTDRFLLNRSV